MAAVHRPRAILGLISNDFPHLLGRAKSIYNGIASNLTLFANPDPPLTVLDDRIKSFDAAQQAVSTRTKGNAAARDIRAGELIVCLSAVQAYVQGVADASPDKAVFIIASAAMMVGKAPAYIKPFLRALQRQPGGAVRLVANVAVFKADTKGTVTFNWQFSSDGINWVTVPSTPRGHTEIPGLTPLTTYRFRASVSDASGPRAWSDAVILLVQ